MLVKGRKDRVHSVLWQQEKETWMFAKTGLGSDPGGGAAGLEGRASKGSSPDREVENCKRQAGWSVG